MWTIQITSEVIKHQSWGKIHCQLSLINIIMIHIFFEKLKDIAIVAFLKYDFILFLGAEGICVQLVGSFSYHGSFSYAMKCLNGVM